MFVVNVDLSEKFLSILCLYLLFFYLYNYNNNSFNTEKSCYWTIIFNVCIFNKCSISLFKNKK